MIESDLREIHLWRTGFTDEHGYPVQGQLFRPYVLGDERKTYARDHDGQWVEVEVLPVRQRTWVSG